MFCGTYLLRVHNVQLQITGAHFAGAFVTIFSQPHATLTKLHFQLLLFIIGNTHDTRMIRIECRTSIRKICHNYASCFFFCHTIISNLAFLHTLLRLPSTEWWQVMNLLPNGQLDASCSHARSFIIQFGLILHYWEHVVLDRVWEFFELHWPIFHSRDEKYLFLFSCCGIELGSRTRVE